MKFFSALIITVLISSHVQAGDYTRVQTHLSLQNGPNAQVLTAYFCLDARANYSEAYAHCRGFLTANTNTGHVARQNINGHIKLRQNSYGNMCGYAYLYTYGNVRMRSYRGRIECRGSQKDLRKSKPLNVERFPIKTSEEGQGCYLTILRQCIERASFYGDSDYYEEHRRIVQDQCIGVAKYKCSKERRHLYWP